MVWLEVEPGFYVHATVQLPKMARRNRSASTATAESGSSGTAAVHPIEDEYLIAALSQSSRRFRLRHGTLARLLRREGKVILLQKLAAHWDRWLRQVDILNSRSLEDVVEAVPHSSLLTASTTSQLRPLLAQFAASNPSALPILLHGQDVLALPKLPEADTPAAQEPGRPPPPRLREDELVDVVRYLADLVPKSTVLAVQNDSSSFQVTRSTTTSAVSNAWSSSLSTLANGMSFLSPRPLSLSLASVSSATEPRQGNQPSAASSKSLRAGFAAMRQQEKAALSAPERDRTPESSAAGPGQGQAASRSRNGEGKGSDVDSAWSFPSVNWSKLGFGGGAATTAAAAAVKSAADVAVNREEASAPLITSSSANEDASSADTPDQSVVSEDGGTFETPSREAETPKVELAPTVNAEELAAAIGVTPEQEDRHFHLVQVRNESTPNGDGTATATGASSPTAAEDDESTEDDHKVLEIYVGGADPSKCQLRRYTRGLLTLGLAVLPSTDDAAMAWLDSRAERLLEAVETMTELVQPPKAVYPHRHLITDGAMVTSVTSSRDAAAGTHSAHGNAAAAADEADEAESAAALLDSYRSLHSSPPILESITRLSSARWALHRQHTTSPPSVSLPRRTREVYAIVPSRNARGRELSLVDAADELRRIERAYEKW
ncbi:hypothetical protein C6P46_000456 [Rhodotorula mucilaginosa]|uniref:Uncharacterized protein n=1 Tax=Rhodotorula mucilaginosa TaxID=5537 RepID=A0A9P6VWU9_RHOMI|nr:hypothetical protein C6P46_000456 [Rhodotorula mucilaginosa]